jgi:hypothetical protein
MSLIRDAATELLAALKALDGVRVYSDPGAAIDPPGVVLGPPTVTWQAFAEFPTDATFIVYAIVPFSDLSLESLWDLLPLVSEAVDTVTNAAVTTATPAFYTAGGTDLPCYQITVEVSLS